jgi:hypothetical protein
MKYKLVLEFDTAAELEQAVKGLPPETTTSPISLTGFTPKHPNIVEHINSCSDLETETIEQRDDNLTAPPHMNEGWLIEEALDRRQIRKQCGNGPHMTEEWLIEEARDIMYTRAKRVGMPAAETEMRAALDKLGASKLSDLAINEYPAFLESLNSFNQREA